jgi:predicted ABC-type ATPase
MLHRNSWEEPQWKPPPSVTERSEAPQIYVLAGPNGAGKSSVVGAMILKEGATYFNPDKAARQILAANEGITQDVANSAAWHEGKRLLEWAINDGLDFAFETTLGGRTITNMLEAALSGGAEVRVWYVGLNSPELHIARVRARVARGGHDIPEERIRERYDKSRYNLIKLLPKLTELRVYDNSEEADPASGVSPQPKLILHLREGRIVEVCGLVLAPEWTKAILLKAIQLQT